MAGDQGYTPEEQKQRKIAALRRERKGYVARNLQPRVDAVDEELRALGVEPGESGDDDSKAARRQPPTGRSARPASEG